MTTVLSTPQVGWLEVSLELTYRVFPNTLGYPKPLVLTSLGSPASSEPSCCTPPRGNLHLKAAIKNRHEETVVSTAPGIPGDVAGRVVNPMHLPETPVRDGKIPLDPTDFS
jgi:hypothetical protein